MLTNAYSGIITRYLAQLPVPKDIRPITLHEGNTPLLPLQHFKQDIFPLEVYAKYEGLNPTGSFKDRGMTLAVSMAVHEGSQAIICASTGNTSASAAAYAAHAGILAVVLIPEGKIAMGKLAQAIMHGAKVIQIRGNFDEGMALVKKISQTLPITLVNSVNPYRLQGQKTIAFEICETLGAAPDYHFLPVGNAGNISAHWFGYREYHQAGVVTQRPKMMGIQAAGAAPFVHGKMIDAPETLATAIRIGHPQSWEYAWQAVNESGGQFLACTDEEILQAQYWLASREGIFCEPASAAALAGLKKACEMGLVEKNKRVVLTLTGHGLKDPDILSRHALPKLMTVDAKLDAVTALLQGCLSHEPD